MNMTHVPLTTLFSWAWIAHTIEVDNAVEAVGSQHVGRHFRISLPMWTNGLRLIGEEGITVGELGRKARAACNIGGLERWGWIAVGEDTGPRRDGYGSRKGVKADTVLRPTRAGAYARKLWPRVVGVVENRWRERFGAGVIDALRARLTAFAPAMPWSPPEVHPSNGFFTHVIAGDTADGQRPLVALLGQALTALTLDHERSATASLPLAANLLRAIGASTVLVRDLPARTGLSKEGIAMAVAYLHRRTLAVSEPGRAIRLTSQGTDALAAYWQVARQHDDDALRGALHALLEQREALAASFVAPEGCWRSQKPYVAQTSRSIVDPLGALPWQPMVLHRGGWPDAS